MPSPIHHDPVQQEPRPPQPETAADAAVKNSLKLPQLRADERVETTTQPPANENNMMLLMQQWQRGRVALLTGSKANLPLIIMFCGAAVSVMWLVAAAVYIHNIVGWRNIAQLLPHEIGGFLAGLLAPVALFWMMLTFWLRSVDVKLYAEALRTEIQALIFPSEEAERRVNNDVERLVRQTSEMARATRLAVGTLAKARQAVQEETQALQQGVHGTAERLEHLEQRLGDRQQALVALEQNFTHKGAAFETVAAGLLRDANLFEQTVDSTAAKTSAIGRTLQAPLGQLQQWQDGIVAALDNSLTQIADRQGLLRVDVAAIEQQAADLAGTLHNATAKLYSFTDDALDKAKLIETRLQGQGLSLQETLQHIAAQTEHLTARRDALLQELAGTTDQGRAELADHVTLLDETMTRLRAAHDTTAGQMRALLDDAATGWSQQADRFAARMQDGAVRQVDLITRAQAGLETGYGVLQADLDAVAGKIDALLDNVATRLQEATAFLQTDIADQQARSQDFVAELGRTHQRAMAGTTHDLLRAQEELNDLATQLAERGADVGVRGAATAAALQSVQHSLQHGLDRLHATTDTLHASLAQTTASLDAPLDRLEQAAHTADDRAQAIGTLLDQRVTQLLDLGGALTNQAVLLGSDLATKSRLLENSLTTLQGGIRTINADMAAQNDLLDTTVRVTLDQVAGILPQIRDIQQNFAQTNAQMDQAQTGIVRLSDTAREQGQVLFDLSEQTVERIADSLATYKQLQDSYRFAHETTLAEHARMRETHALDVAALVASSDALRSNAAQLGDRYEALQSTLQALGQEAVQTQGFARQAQDALQETQGALAQSGQAVQQQAASAALNLRIVQQILDGSAQSTLNHVENLVGSLQQAELHSSLFQERAEKLADITHTQAGHVVEAATRLGVAADSTQRSFETLTGFSDTVENLQERIGGQQARVTAQQEALDAAVTQALAKLQAQTETLARTTQDAGAQADTIRAQDQALQRDYFFNATKFIVESLHSLALDFTRMLDGEVPEKTWKAYKMGDTSVFAKRLVGLRDTLSHDKLRQKFADDAEFRTYVQRYLRQFEEIHEHAKRQDYGDLLSGVFTSSDIGRLYQMLKKIVAE